MDGNVLWDTRYADSSKGYNNTSGPLVVQGKVIQGMNGCDRYKETGCYISAFDAQTGKPLWKFETVAREGTENGAEEKTYGMDRETCRSSVMP